MEKKIKILFTGGGSLGHIMPQIAVARELKKLSFGGLDLHYIGPNDAFSILLLSQEGFKTHAIASGKIRRYFAVSNILDLFFSIPLGFVQSFFILLFYRPNIVFSKGGSGSLPVTFCARVLLIPVFLHESDIVPGLSNKITSIWSKKVFTSFEKTEYFNLSKAICVGNPVRQELLDGSRETAKDLFNLSLSRPVILFWGGSQGAKPLNDFVVLALNDLLEKYEVLHVVGEKNIKEFDLEAKMILKNELERYYHPVASLREQELKHILKVCDLIVSRAGSGGIFEIAQAGKPSILVPLPNSAQRHQSKNAYAYAKNGACVIVEQENLSPNLFFGKIDQILSSQQIQENMSKAALAFAKPLAGKAIAREIFEFIKK